MSVILKINPYTLPSYALRLVSDISLAQDGSDIKVYKKKIDDFLFEPLTEQDSDWFSFFDRNRRSFFDEDFKYKLQERLDDIAIELQSRSHQCLAQIAVAGGTSSGKSYFINHLIGKRLLPEDTNETTSNTTFVYCGKPGTQVAVKGVNKANSVVLLNEDVINAIRFGNDDDSRLISNAIASSLSKIYIEVPTPQDKKKIVDIAFIDSPGYNGQNHVERARYTGRDLIDKLSIADVVFWLVSAGAGELSTTDTNEIEKFGKKKVLILVTKGNLHADFRSVTDKVYRTAKNNLGGRLLGVIAMGSENEELYSPTRSSLTSIFKKIRREKKKMPIEQNGINTVSELFDLELKYYDELIVLKKKWVQEKVGISREQYDRWQNVKAIETTSELARQLSIIRKEQYDETHKSIKEARTEIDSIEKLKRDLSTFKRQLFSIINKAIDTYKERNREVPIGEIHTKQYDVFKAIKDDDFDKFVLCFVLGVDLTNTNDEGYTPLTWAVKHGNNAMVRFLMDHRNLIKGKHDLLHYRDGKDGEGYNAFEEAVKNHFKDICEMILSDSDDFLNNGDELLDLANNKDFYSWLKEKIDNY